jgi:hypothetical protein
VFLEDRIKRLAATYAGAGTQAEIVRRIQEDLARKYTYNLDTGEIKKGENFLDKFLFVTKSGYSTHFATALIVFARLNGIPARYATGFLAVIPQPKVGSQTPFFGFKTVLTGLSAHVWPEVWFAGRGWTIVEATPAVIPDSYTKTDEGLVFNGAIKLNPYTKKQLSGILGESIVEPKKESAKEPGIHISLDPINLVYILVPLVLLFIIVRYFYMIRYAFVKNRKTFNYLGKKIVRKHIRNEIPAPGSEGWIRWGEELKERTLGKHASLIDEFTGTMLRAAYSGVQIEKSDVITVYAVYRTVKSVKKLKARAGK